MGVLPALALNALFRVGIRRRQKIESEHCNLKGSMTLEASFDESNLDLRLTYQGDPVILEDRRPSLDEIHDSEEGVRRLAGFLLKRCADNVRTSSIGNKSTIEFRFEH